MTAAKTILHQNLKNAQNVCLLIVVAAAVVVVLVVFVVVFLLSVTQRTEEVSTSTFYLSALYRGDEES